MRDIRNQYEGISVARSGIYDTCTGHVRCWYGASPLLNMGVLMLFKINYLNIFVFTYSITNDKAPFKKVV